MKSSKISLKSNEQVEYVMQQKKKGGLDHAWLLEGNPAKKTGQVTPVSIDYNIMCFIFALMLPSGYNDPFVDDVPFQSDDVPWLC